MHYMVCISGFAGAGKDECATQLVNNHGAVQTGLADPGKRHMADAYGFTEKQLFGPSQFRNAGDVRIPKNTFREFDLTKWNGPLPDLKPGINKKYKIDLTKKYWTYPTAYGNQRPYFDTESDGRLSFVQEGDPEFWLSPREALQIYLEKMNTLDIYTWIRKGVEDQLYIASGKYGYNRMRGLLPAEEVYELAGGEQPSGIILPRIQNKITCFADFRHIQEIQYVRDFSKKSMVSYQPILIRVKRPSIPVPPYDHRSETEQTKIRDAAFDAIVHNDEDLSHLYAQIDYVIQKTIGGEIKPKSWLSEYVIENRKPSEGYAP
jgi:hypothetical protein